MPRISMLPSAYTCSMLLLIQCLSSDGFNCKQCFPALLCKALSQQQPRLSYGHSAGGVVCGVKHEWTHALQAPWGLACLEAASALLTYMTLVPCAIPVRCGLQQFHYALGHSMEDVVLLSLLRAAAIVVAYLCASVRSCKQ